MSNVIVAQSGGPTAAINASLAGVIKGYRDFGGSDHIYGAVHGISGVLEENFLLLDYLLEGEEDKQYGMTKELRKLYVTPSSFLGSCRYKMPEPDTENEIYKKIFEILNRMNVSEFFYIGGNDSMDTIAKLSKYGDMAGSPVRFAGVPKTIDNDLKSIDHTPGYGSAARYIAASMLEIGHDTAIYDIPCVTIVEIMGRDAGWLTAASALARNEYNPAPHLIYLPETAFDPERFIEDVRNCLKIGKNVVVAVSEGIRDKDGNYMSAGRTSSDDKFGHVQLSGAGKVLEHLVKHELGIKCRSVELNILQRCAGHLTSATDLAESFSLGHLAAELASKGRSGFMPTLTRVCDSDRYEVSYGEADLSEIANQERLVPREWINDAGNDVTDELIDYMRPLIEGDVIIDYANGLPEYAAIPHLTKHIDQ